MSEALNQNFNPIHLNLAVEDVAEAAAVEVAEAATVAAEVVGTAKAEVSAHNPALEAAVLAVAADTAEEEVTAAVAHPMAEGFPVVAEVEVSFLYKKNLKIGENLSWWTQSE